MVFLNNKGANIFLASVGKALNQLIADQAAEPLSKNDYCERELKAHRDSDFVQVAALQYFIASLK